MRKGRERDETKAGKGSDKGAPGAVAPNGLFRGSAEEGQWGRVRYRGTGGGRGRGEGVGVSGCEGLQGQRQHFQAGQGQRHTCRAAWERRSSSAAAVCRATLGVWVHWGCV